MGATGLTYRYHLLTLARATLVRARILRQEATLTIEASAMGDPDGQLEVVSDGLRSDAKEARLEVKWYLQEIERLNGVAYFTGKPYTPLNSHLNGKRFRDWLVYAQEYSMHKWFQGRDPE